MADDAELLREHGGKLLSAFFVAVGSGLVAFSKWAIGREVSRMDSQHRDHETRLRHLEANVATKDDVQELRETLTQQHGQLLDAILAQRTGGR